MHMLTYTVHGRQSVVTCSHCITTLQPLIRFKGNSIMFCSFPLFFKTAQQNKQTNKRESLPQRRRPVIGSWYTNKGLSWLKKATAEALPDLRTFVTNGVSSLTLSCLTKTNPHSKQHPSVLVENNDRLPFCCTQSIWILSLLPLFYLW